MSDDSRDPEMAALIDAEGRVREPPQTREELERLVRESDARGLEGVVSIKITPHLLLELVRDRDEAQRVSADAVKRRRVAETAAVALQERLDAAEARAAQERARCRAVAQHEMDSVANESPEAAACEAIIRGIQDGDDPRYFVPTCEDVEEMCAEIAELQALLHDDPDVRAARESAAQRCAEIIESYCGKDHSPHEACWRYVYAHEGGEKIRAEFGLGEEGA